MSWYKANATTTMDTATAMDSKQGSKNLHKADDVIHRDTSKTLEY